MKGNRKPGRFLIPSLLAAGFTTHDRALAALPEATTPGGDDPNAGNILRHYSQDHLVTLAQHSSHASHASHSSGGYSGGSGHASHMSHTSHRSSATYEPYDDADYGTTPAANPAPLPLPEPAPPPPPPPVQQVPRATPPAGAGGMIAPQATPQATVPALSGRTQRFAAIVRRVQIALLAQGFYDGPINGVVGPTTRAALRQFQGSRSLSVTGTITPQTLDALKVSSQ